ncbi:GNAT family N-acetyltransferase [Caulobacter sp. KR2-114]|uniref:GNAT family N-acetyltransferase n=1 Tax=Caulobacter sp. KR2-114 TaxID=3400912 RepID=UPI003C05B6A6
MPPADIQIRALEAADFDDVAEIFAQPRAVWGTLQAPYLSVEARRARHLALPPGHTAIGAVVDGKVIGAAGLHPEANRRRAHVASIGMAVHDGFAGRGAGRALLGALLELADRWQNFSRIELTVWADNDRAIRLYEGAGFVREGLHRAYAFRDGAYVDAIAMARLREGLA